MAPDFRRRTWSSSAGGSATERSPSPPEVFLAPRRLDGKPSSYRHPLFLSLPPRFLTPNPQKPL